MNSFSFWQKWLLVVALLLTAFGLALALFNQALVFDILFNNQVNPVFWPSQEITPQIAKFQQWVYGVLGATVAGWGIFTACLAHYPFRNKERWAWNAIALGITVWFIADTSLSLYFQVNINAAFNALVFAAVLLPLLFTRQAFN